jgi:hypothetical protein
MPNSGEVESLVANLPANELEIFDLAYIYSRGWGANAHARLLKPH